jgi:hypothetical protein
VDSSPAVGKKLRLETMVGEVHVTWSDGWIHTLRAELDLGWARGDAR